MRAQSLIEFALRSILLWGLFLKDIFQTPFDGFKLALHLIYMKNETMNSNWIRVHNWIVGRENGS